MGGFAFETNAHAVAGISARNNSHRAPFRIKDRALLNVKFKIGVDLATACCTGSSITDTLQFIPETNALVINKITHPIGFIFAYKRPRRHHRR